MTLRFFAAAATALLLALGACDCQGLPSCDGDRSGEEGGCCRAEAPLCDAGLTCFDTECVPCGDVGERCCSDPSASSSFGTCNDGATCLGDMCDECGRSGEQCCLTDRGDFCLDGLVCDRDDFTCTAGCEVPDGATLRPISVGVINENGCGLQVITVESTDFSSAVLCVEGQLRPGERVLRRENPDLREISGCRASSGVGRQNRTVQAFSEGDAMDCACGGFEQRLRTCCVFYLGVDCEECEGCEPLEGCDG